MAYDGAAEGSLANAGGDAMPHYFNVPEYQMPYASVVGSMNNNNELQPMVVGQPLPPYMPASISSMQPNASLQQSNLIHQSGVASSSHGSMHIYLNQSMVCIERAEYERFYPNTLKVNLSSESSQSESEH